MEGSLNRWRAERFAPRTQRTCLLCGLGAIVGFLAGIVAVLFRALLAGADALRNYVIDWAQATPTFGWIFPVLFSAPSAGDGKPAAAASRISISSMARKHSEEFAG